MNRLVFVAALLSLAACTAPITLQHPQTGQKVQCGPYADTWTTPQRESQCISDYQRQGFQRVPN